VLPRKALGLARLVAQRVIPWAWWPAWFPDSLVRWESDLVRW